jgi:hypothetical protein
MTNNITTKLLIILQLAINIIVMVVYLFGFNTFKYFSIGWVAIAGILILYLLNQKFGNSPRTGLGIIDLMLQNRTWLGFNLALAFLGFVPIFGWIAIFFGLKFCFDDIMYLWNQLNNHNVKSPLQTQFQDLQDLQNIFDIPQPKKDQFVKKPKIRDNSDTVVDVEAK